MKPILFVLLTLAGLSDKVCAQTAINSGFGTITMEGGYLLDFSIGEMSSITTLQSEHTGAIQQITQGFLQPPGPLANKPRTSTTPLLNTVLSPNPATDRVLLQGNWAAQQNAHCTLFSATGQVVWAQEIVGNTAILQLDQFYPGIYFLEITVEGKYETLQLVKSN